MIQGNRNLDKSDPLVDRNEKNSGYCHGRLHITKYLQKKALKSILKTCSGDYYNNAREYWQSNMITDMEAPCMFRHRSDICHKRFSRACESLPNLNL